MDRLSLATLSRVPHVSQPPLDPRAVTEGIVHLGIGAFHRAHQAVYTQAAMAASGATDWGICGVTQRSDSVVEQLAPQDGLYTVLQRGASHSDAGVVGSVRSVLSGRHQAGDVLDRIAAPPTRVVTLTVTEKGYRHDPASGRLRADDAGILADAAGAQPSTVVGRLARGLQRRQQADAGPLTVVCCDNLPSNGRVLRGLVEEFCALLPVAEGRQLAEWIAANVTFPSTMVDRIVPATTDDDRAEAERILGLTDAGVVVAEPFSQWVIEDTFAAARPSWELAGATLTTDVAPYEKIKLRLLNGAHSSLAYLGALAGDRSIADVMRRDHFRAFAAALMAIDATPTLTVPDGVDVAAYAATVLERFANPALGHLTTQIAMDGSHKLPQRLLGTVRDRRAAGAEPAFASMAVAAWIRYVTNPVADDGRPLPVDDPLADRFAEIGRRGGSAGARVTAMLAVREVFGDDLAGDATFHRLVTDALVALDAAGADAAVRAMMTAGGQG